MTPLPLLVAPDPRLKVIAQPVACVDAAAQKTLEHLRVTMLHYQGIGLAATQVGITQRLLVIDLSGGRSSPRDTTLPQPFAFKMANPEIIWSSTQLEKFEEGCLSVPGAYGTVKRPHAIKVTYLDEDNHPQTLEASGLLADVIQHEIDHLNGHLFIDALSSLKRSRALRKVKKFMDEGGYGPLKDCTKGCCD